VLGLNLAMGFVFTLVNVNNTRLAMALTPAMGRSHFFALYSVVSNLSLGLSPVLWGLALDAIGDRSFVWHQMTWGRYSFFFGGVLVAFLVNAALALRLVEPKSSTIDQLLRDILIVSPQRSLLRLWKRSR
jgi:uncharacterized membrane protein